MDRLRLPVRPGVLLIAALLIGAVTAAAPALAASSPNPVINDCLTHPSGLSGHYTKAELNHALAVMPAETKEYTDCPDVINRALLGAVGSGSGSGSGGSGSSFLPTPVIVVLVVLVLAAVAFGAAALRRRRPPGA